MEDNKAGERRSKKARTTSAGLSASAAADDASDLKDSAADKPCSVRVDPAPGLDILNRILSANTSLSTHLSGLETQTPACIKAKEIVSSQAEPITELRDMFLDATSKGGLVDGHAVFSKASALVHGTQNDFFPLLIRGLPSYVSELVLQQDEMISGLRHSYFAAAGGGGGGTSTKTPEVSSSGTPHTPEVGVGRSAPASATPDRSSSTMCSGVYADE